MTGLNTELLYNVVRNSSKQTIITLYLVVERKLFHVELGNGEIISAY